MRRRHGSALARTQPAGTACSAGPDHAAPATVYRPVRIFAALSRAWDFRALIMGHRIHLRHYYGCLPHVHDQDASGGAAQVYQKEMLTQRRRPQASSRTCSFLTLTTALSGLDSVSFHTNGLSPIGLVTHRMEILSNVQLILDLTAQVYEGSHALYFIEA